LQPASEPLPSPSPADEEVPLQARRSGPTHCREPALNRMLGSLTLAPAVAILHLLSAAACFS
jgi:hypothetical protein